MLGARFRQYALGTEAASVDGTVHATSDNGHEASDMKVLLLLAVVAPALIALNVLTGRIETSDRWSEAERKARQGAVGAAMGAVMVLGFVIVAPQVWPVCALVVAGLGVLAWRRLKSA